MEYYAILVINRQGHQARLKLTMKDETAARLLKINRAFYAQFAAPFANSRSTPQPGFVNLLENLPAPCQQVLDVGCGNGRFGRYLQSEHFALRYSGVDFTEELLALAARDVKGNYYRRDISQPGFLGGIGKFDLIVCLATMQHIPGRVNRNDMLREMRNHLKEDGRIFLSNWQFLESSRQRRKIRDWADVNLSEEDVEKGDYLLSWQREGSGLRYVCAIDAEETAVLVRHSGLRQIAQFRSDGREGNLNLYTVLAHEIQP